MKATGLRLSMTLLTVIPWPGAGQRAGDDTAAALPRATVAAAMAWAPAVGLLLGVIASAVLLVADHPLGAGPLTAAGLAIGLLALLSRGLHLDGLADLADGLASGKPAPAALDIMRRSDIGPLGTVTLILTLLIQVAALSHAESSGDGRGPASLIVAVVTGRLAITWACRRGVPGGQAGRAGRACGGHGTPRDPGGDHAGHYGGCGRSGGDLRNDDRRTARLDPAARRRRRPWRRVRCAAARSAPTWWYHRRCSRRAGRSHGHRHPGGGRDGPAGLTVVSLGSARRSAERRSPAQGRRRPPSANAPGTSSPSGRRASGSSGRPGAGSADNPRCLGALRRSRS